MKNPFLPPRSHPRLYAREYLRLRPLIDWLAFLAGCAVGLPLVCFALLWIFRLAFGFSL